MKSEKVSLYILEPEILGGLEKIMKRICLAVLMIAVLLFSQIATFAAPETVANDATGNSSSLVVVTKPKNQKDSTFDGSYIVSGYGKEGTTVTFYKYSEKEGVYNKMYNESQYVDANGETQKTWVASEVKIGTSGMFMNPIYLTQGDNVVLVRAENGDKVQLMKLSLTKYSYNLFDILKALTD